MEQNTENCPSCRAHTPHLVWKELLLVQFSRLLVYSGSVSVKSEAHRLAVAGVGTSAVAFWWVGLGGAAFVHWLLMGWSLACETRGCSQCSFTGPKELLSDRCVLSCPSMDLVTCLLDFRLNLASNRSIVPRLAASLAACAQLSALGKRHRYSCTCLPAWKKPSDF